MKKSFTLLEMLIVLGIIAVILSVLTVSFSTAQKKSRDAKRKSDVKGLQTALEQYYSTCGYKYPASIPDANSIVCNGNVIVSTAPLDPQTASPYPYATIDPANSGFTVCSNNIESESITGFCLSNQQ